MRALAITAVVFLGASSGGQPPASQGVLAIRGATVIATTAPPIRDATVVIRGERIAAVGPSAAILDADPLADIANTRRIAAVILRGLVYEKDGIARLLAAVETAADRKVDDWGRTSRQRPSDRR